MGENYISCGGELGSINISEDVISSIVESAISEIEVNSVSAKIFFKKLDTAKLYMK